MKDETTVSEGMDLSGLVFSVAPPPRCVEDLRLQVPDYVQVPAAGDLELRERFCATSQRITGFNPRASRVTVVPMGSSSAITWVFSLFREGLIVFFTPNWSGYMSCATLANVRRVITVETSPSENWCPTADLVRECLYDIPCDLVVVNNFATPTGASWTRDSARSLGLALLRHPSCPCVLTDNLCWMNAHDGGEFEDIAAATPELWEADRLFGTASTAKGFALHNQNGLGFLWGPQEVISRLVRNQAEQGKTANPKLQLGMRAAFSPEGLETTFRINSGCVQNLIALRELVDSHPAVSLALDPRGGVNALLLVHNLIGSRDRTSLIESASDLTTGLHRQVGVFADSLKPKAGGDYLEAIRINLASQPPVLFRQAVGHFGRYLHSLH